MSPLCSPVKRSEPYKVENKVTRNLDADQTPFQVVKSCDMMSKITSSHEVEERYAFFRIDIIVNSSPYEHKKQRKKQIGNSMLDTSAVSETPKRREKAGPG
jgi:hypothetical protein